MARRVLLPAWWWLVPLLLLTFWLGARGLNADIVWRDEYHSLEDAGVGYLGPLSPVGVWRNLAETNPWHAPGYFLLLNGWQRVVGADPAALRSMSLLFGLLAVALTYHVGRQAAGARVGLYAAILLGTSAFFVHFHHELRVYSLMALLSVATVALYWHLIDARRRPGWRLWVAFVACAAGLFYSHYFAAVTLAGLGVYHLLFAPRGRRWWGVLAALALAAALFAPWLAVLARALGLVAARENLNTPALSFGEALLALAYQLSNGATPLLLVVLAAALLAYRRRGWHFLLATAAVSTLVLLGLNSVVEVMAAGRLRYLIGLWPLLALLLALGMVWLNRWRRLGWLALVLWAGLGVYNSTVGDLTPDLDGAAYIFPFQHVAQALDARAHEGDVVVAYLPDEGLHADLYETIATYYFAPVQLDYLLAWTPDEASWTATQAGYLDVLAGRERVWLATMPGREPAHAADFVGALQPAFGPCMRSDAPPGVELRLFARTPEACD